MEDLFANDSLFLRRGKEGNSPFEYLYFHLNDEKGANFVAYFKNMKCNTPVVYRLEKVHIDGLCTRLDADNDITCDNVDKEYIWERVRYPNMIVTGTWKNEIELTRQKLLDIENNGK